MNNFFLKHLEKKIDAIKDSGSYKIERTINSPQSPVIEISNKGEFINCCSNNYLGLANDPRLIGAAKDALEKYGYGTASVRFICGTLKPHEDLERLITKYLRMEETVLFPSCFDANAGVFESLLDEKDAIISDQLNHASIIDGIRLSKAVRFRYKNNDMKDLEENLKKSEKKGVRFKLIVTDGVFSMDGSIAKLREVCNLATKYNAITMVDDSHATGIIGKQGRGTPSFCNVEKEIDIITGTLGKALGGASGGFISTRSPIGEIIKQKSRPYLFSNALPPMIASASIEAIKISMESEEKRERLHSNQNYFRKEMSKAGFDVMGGNHPIVPIMLYDEKRTLKMAEELQKRNIYAVAFSYPVVPKKLARIRIQISSGHSFEQIKRIVENFIDINRK